MNEANRFQFDLANVVHPGQPDNLLWPSESDFRVDVVELAWWRVLLWPKERNHSIPEPPAQLLYQTFLIGNSGLALSVQGRYRRLYQLFSGYTHSRYCKAGGVFYRSTSEPAVRELYLLLKFGSQWVGIKTKVVET
ncbi:hypothetical protein ACAW74_18265 [Fibrella sp. WM1]|uniref:hypothetical protein n=1 Tax=Fibrella musci TaxID=3242485 RepID=UPI003521B51A